MTTPHTAETIGQESAAAAIGRLLRTMPDPFAPVSAQVEWLFAKADVLRLIARETPDPIAAAQARELAAAADRRAFDIARKAT